MHCFNCSVCWYQSRGKTGTQKDNWGFCCVAFLGRHLGYLGCLVNYQQPILALYIKHAWAWLAMDEFLLSTCETIFRSAFSCPFISDRWGNREFLTGSFMRLSHCLSLLWFIKHKLSVSPKLTGFQSAPLKREIYMLSLSSGTPSLTTMLCLFFSLFLLLPSHTDIFK